MELLLESEFNNEEQKRIFNRTWKDKFKNFLVGQDIRWSYSNGYSYTKEKCPILDVFVGAKSGNIILKTINGNKSLDDFNVYRFKKGHLEAYEEEANIKILEMISNYKTEYNAAAKEANGDAKSLQTREEKFEDQVAVGKDIAKDVPVDAEEWLLNNIINIKFTLPAMDKIPATEKRTEKKIKSDHDMLEKLYPGITSTRHFGWENKNPENAVFSFWGLTGFTYFKVSYEDFPQEIKEMVIKAKNISRAKGQWNIENAKPTDKVINNIYFAHAIIDLFGGDYTFCDKPIDGQPENPFDLEFDDVNAYGEKVESLREAKEEVCCICGEPIEGHGNNPEPYKHEGRCCDACNAKFVIPARLDQLNNKDKAEEE